MVTYIAENKQLKVVFKIGKDKVLLENGMLMCSEEQAKTIDKNAFVKDGMLKKQQEKKEVKETKSLEKK